MSALISKYSSFFGMFSSDIVFILSLFLILYAYAMYFGKGRIVSFILAFYPATLLYNAFPFVEKAMILHGDKLILLNKFALFLVFFIPINIIINRFIFSPSEYSSQNLLSSGGLALSALILIMAFSYTTLSFDPIHNFGDKIDSLFVGVNRLFYWNLASIALLAVL